MTEPKTAAELRADLVADRERLKREIAEVEAPSALNASTGMGSQSLDAELHAELAEVEHRLARLDAGADPGQDVVGTAAVGMMALFRANPVPIIVAVIASVVGLALYLAVYIR